MRLTPDLVLCSAARRTVETWNHLAVRLGRKATVMIEPDLYLAEADALLDRLRAAAAGRGDRPADRPQPRHGIPGASLERHGRRRRAAADDGQIPDRGARGRSISTSPAGRTSPSARAGSTASSRPRNSAEAAAYQNVPARSIWRQAPTSSSRSQAVASARWPRTWSMTAAGPGPAERPAFELGEQALADDRVIEVAEDVLDGPRAPTGAGRRHRDRRDWQRNQRYSAEP